MKPPSSPLEAPFQPPSSPLEAPLKPSEGEAPFNLHTFVPPPPRPQTLQAPLKGASEGGTSEPAPTTGPPRSETGGEHGLQAG